MLDRGGVGGTNPHLPAGLRVLDRDGIGGSDVTRLQGCTYWIGMVLVALMSSKRLLA